MVSSDTVVCHWGPSIEAWSDIRVIPLYFTLLSSCLVVIPPLFHRLHTSKRSAGEILLDSELYRRTREEGYVQIMGGWTILLWKLVRVVSCGTFLGSAIVLFLTTRGAQNGSVPFVVRVSTLILAAYATLLSTLFLHPSISRRTSTALSIVLNTTLLSVAAIYCLRNLWPYATFNQTPPDLAAYGGALLWTLVVSVTVSGALVPLMLPRVYEPIDPLHPSPAPAPEQTASIISLVLFLFLDPLILHPTRQPRIPTSFSSSSSVESAYQTEVKEGHIALEQLPPLADYDRAAVLQRDAFPYMDTFTNGKKRHVFWGVLAYFKWPLLIQAIAISGRGISEMIKPIGLNRLLAYLENDGYADAGGAYVRPWFWIVLLFVGPLAMELSIQWYFFVGTRSVVRLESIMTQLIFEHALRIRMKAETSATPSSSTDQVLPLSTGGKKEGDQENKNLVGKINNLISTDLSQIQNARDFMWAVIYAPLEIVLGVIFLYVLLGWASIVGLVVMIALLPVPTQFAKLFHGLQTQKMKATDDRVQTVTEVMGMLRMVKLFAWESRVEAQIDEKREAEMSFVWKGKITQMIMNNLNYAIPLVHMVVTYWVYTSVMEQIMTASVVFSSMAAFSLIRNQFFYLMYTIPLMIQAKVSFDRVNEFLTQTELLDQYTDRSLESQASTHRTEIGFGSARFSWSTEMKDIVPTPSGTQREHMLRADGDVVFKKGAINLIVGPTGSGKTSVLMALLGEMHFMPTAPGAWVNLPREGGVGYAAQESWVQNETIRDNILFGAPYHEIRYKKVIYQCALRRDLELFDAGDMTEVGEKGLTLSGGQKARLTLARAIYSSASILLLDDVLAALDVHTSRWIVEKCFKGDLIRGRTVIFVTHNVALMSPISEYVVTLGNDGRVSSTGSVQDVIHHDSTFRAEIVQEEKLLSTVNDTEAVDNEDVDVAAIETGGANKSGKLIIEEEYEVGRMGKQPFSLLASSMAGNWGAVYWVGFLGCILVNHIFDSGQVWWLGHWANAYNSNPEKAVDNGYYIGHYVLLIVAGMAFYVAATVQHAFGTVRASITLHRRLVYSVLRTTLRWLDATPTSRIITRCTQDINAVDTGVVNALETAIDVTGSILIKLVAVVIFTPIFVFPGILVGIVGGYLAHLYMKVQLPIKREMSNAKSPVVAHFSAAIAGLVSIRAYAAEEAFKTESLRRIDIYTRAGRSFWNVNRWISVRINLLSSVFTPALAVYMVYVAKIQNVGNIGFSIDMAVGFSGMILWWVRLMNDLEVQGNSLERINQYLVIENEPEATPAGVPPAYWPASGKLVVEGLSARYSADGPRVLKDVSFTIESGEHIGIVGRTGSGKSSLALSLLRTILTEGKVYFDGLATSGINLDALRSNITIIPQVPELLSGTLRHNLDPFGLHDDATLNDILRSSGITSIRAESDGVRLDLDSPIASRGENLSVGQKQLLALTRAMLRQSKVIILDEATSAIDYETDALIQKSLRNEFKDITLITVAHRLQTIMDADRIMVLDAGRLVEYDAPLSLLENKDSLFYSLVQGSSDKEILISIAKGKELRAGSTV